MYSSFRSCLPDNVGQNVWSRYRPEPLLRLNEGYLCIRIWVVPRAFSPSHVILTGTGLFYDIQEVINMEKGFKKYVPFEQIKIKNRRWPDNTITKAPIWCSVDLRDGNQALIVPMSLGEKLEFFKIQFFC